MKTEVLECIKTRRSIRTYEERQISDEQLQELLEAAVWAPSGSNSQSWLFTAIQDKEILLQLNEAVRDGFQRWEPDDDYPQKQTARTRSQNPGYCFYYHAPTLIIASNVPGYANSMADCSAALQNIFLAAHAIGLGSCWINQLRWLTDDAGVREHLAGLGIPREHVICGAAAVGYAAHEPAPPPRKEGTVNIVR